MLSLHLSMRPHEDEYVWDINFYGAAPALSYRQWMRYQQDALKRLSFEFFGASKDDSSQSASMLSVVKRASHSHFASCDTCYRNKQKWLDLRVRWKTASAGLVRAVCGAPRPEGAGAARGDPGKLYRTNATLPYRTPPRLYVLLVIKIKRTGSGQ